MTDTSTVCDQDHVPSLRTADLPAAGTPSLVDQNAAFLTVIRRVHLEHRWSSHEDSSGWGDCWCNEPGTTWEGHEQHADHVAAKVVEALTAHGLLAAARRENTAALTRPTF